MTVRLRILALLDAKPGMGVSSLPSCRPTASSPWPSRGP